jgi:signal transduction histidine kinase
MGFFQSQHIPGYYENAIEEIITSENFNRTQKLSIILFSANLIFLFIDYNNRARGLWITNNGYRYLFYSHAVLGLVSLLYILAYYKIITQSSNNVTLLHKSYVIIFPFFILFFTAITSGWIDQKIHNQITVYIIGCITMAVMHNYKPKVAAFLYGLSGVVFLVLVSITQPNPNIRQANYINASLLVVISYFLSMVLYKFKQQEMLYKYHLEDLVTERTKELQTEIIERKRAEEEIIRLDRLNVIGKMAASISHEVRNPMTTVKGFLQLLKNKQESKDKEYFDLMIEELDRANSILSEFLSISKTKPTLYEWHNINDIVGSILPLIQADALANDKSLSIELNSVPNLQFDIQKIRQLLLNLVRNGFEAMSNCGQLKIRTFSTNSAVVLAVSDEGNGINQCTLDKLGTPFFTTKEQGTGLGLAVCYGIVSRHNGRISIETGPTGSTFYVSFERNNSGNSDGSS